MSGTSPGVWASYRITFILACTTAGSSGAAAVIIDGTAGEEGVIVGGAANETNIVAATTSPAALDATSNHTLQVYGWFLSSTGTGASSQQMQTYLTKVTYYV